MANLHRKIPRGLNLESIFSIKTKRVLKNDWTFLYNNQLYQIEETPPNTRIKSVVVEERIDNTIHITYNGIELNIKKIEKRPLKPKEEKEQLKIRKVHILPLDHPWRRFKMTYIKDLFYLIQNRTFLFC